MVHPIRSHPIDMGFLLSNDGIHFREPAPDFAFVPRGAKGSWESDAILQGNGFENVGDKTYVWYGGWDNDVTRPDVHAEIGLVTLRRDGFGSRSTMNFPEAATRHRFFPLDASGSAGFVTCPVRVNGTAQAWVNAEGLSSDARLRVELLDEREKPLPGYSGDSSMLLERSGVRLPVTWKDHLTISSLQPPFPHQGQL